MKPLTDERGEVRELTKEDLAQFKPASEVLPATLMEKLYSMNQPVEESIDVQTTVNVDADVVAFFKAAGSDWQTRINAILRDYVSSH